MDYVEQPATAGQIDAERAYAAKLLQNGQGVIPGAAVSPLQGLGGVLGALAGRKQMFDANAQDRALQAGVGQGAAKVTTGPLAVSPPGADASGPTALSDPLSSFSHAISKNEGNGSYTQMGTQTRTGDRAYGKYQVMGANIPQWTQEAIGQPLSADQFLKSPEAQEAVFRKKFGDYVDKYGPEGAARAWYAGEKGMNNPNATDINGKITVDQYGKKFLNNLGAGGGAPQPPSQALAFNGEPTNQAPPQAGDPSSMALALRAGAAPGGIPTPNAAPAGGVPPGQTAPAPSMFTQRPHIDPETFSRLISNPYTPPEMKEKLFDLYTQQNQPVQAPGMGGNWIMGADGKSRFIPDLQSQTFKGAGGSEAPVGSFLGPDGKRHFIQNADDGSQGGSKKAAPEEVPDILKYNAEPGQQPAAPTGPLGAQPPPGIGTPPAGNAQDAITQALGHAQQSGGAPAGGALPFDEPDEAPPSVKTASAAPAGPLGATPPPGIGGPAPVKVAQAIPKQATDAIGQLNQMGVDYERNKKFADEDVENYMKKYTGVQDAGVKATQTLPQIKMAEQTIDNPNFYSGIGADWVQALKKLKVAAGLGDPNAAAANELFTKLVSGNLIDDMKIQLQGLGQVRVAEINLLSKATGNIYNTPAANRAVLSIMEKTHQQAADMSKAVNLYQQGYRYDDAGKAHKVQGEAPTTAGLDSFMQSWYDKHPLFTDDQIKNYTQLFDKNKQDNGGKLQPLLNGKNESDVKQDYEKAIDDARGGKFYTRPDQPSQAAPGSAPQGGVALPPGWRKE